ncbi:MAG: AmmeMemoRadiSam system radical SAM enzyme [Tepidanaerobacteraceae bacterium]|jgi:pyruvate formate lyase activating enzyme|nr:AmmeMemoRadiSam system radical SAM enzyme [Tepidanaerobacteraceae bacterium]
MKEALFFERTENGMVHCLLCPHHCGIAPGRAGTCRVRKNIDGTLYSENYARVSSWGMDPIEKKPLYHFFPGSWIFSVGSFGCNFRCRFCQNWQIAQLTEIPTEEISAEELVNAASRQKDNIGIAYTYNEPTIWYEYVIECARLAREKGLKNVLVTNGFIEQEPLEQILPYIDAMNIDVKAYTEDFYRDMTFGKLSPVKRTVEIAQKSCHVEITTLLIPGMNDGDDEIESLAKWLASLRKDIPLHLTRYFPNFRLDLPPTPVETIRRARRVAMKYLDYVYTGNVADEEGSNTYCPKCGKLLIARRGYDVEVLGGAKCQNLPEHRCLKNSSKSFE